MLNPRPPSRPIIIGTPAPAAPWPPAPAPAPRRSAERSGAFLLHALAEFLNSLLEFVFAAGAKILASPLRSGNAHGFCRRIGPRPIHRQARKIAGTDRGVAVSTSAKTGQHAFDATGLKTP